MTPPDLLTPDQAAAQLQISTKTLRRYRNRGLPYVMLSGGTIRYKAEDLADFIDARKITCRSAPKKAASGITTSGSTVVDFQEVAGRKTTRPRAQ